MCTRALWNPAEGQVLAGRNMDWDEQMGTELWALPAGIERQGLKEGGLRWTSKHGSLVACTYGIASSDGVNDAGLGAHVLWLAESEFGDAKDTDPNLSVALWLQYVLDNFSSVEEMVSAFEQEPLRLAGQQIPGTGREVAVHLVVEDATGDSAIIEYLDDGTQKIHHDRAYAVATNSPPFDQQLQHQREFAGLGGDKPLPGTTEAADRFVRAAYYVKQLPEPDSARQAVASILSVMRNAAQPFGVVDPTRPNISSTIWRTVADLGNRTYFFESSFEPSILWVSVDGLDLSLGSPARKLDLVNLGDSLAGDVTDQFKVSEPFEFLLA